MISRSFTCFQSSLKSSKYFLRIKPFYYQFSISPKPLIPIKTQKQMKEKEISEKLKTKLNATFVEVIDTSNSGCIYFK